MIAVSTHGRVNVRVDVDPANAYEYTDVHRRARRVVLPEGVRITSSSAIVFRPDGSAENDAVTVFEADAAGTGVERWVVTTSVLGIMNTTYGIYQ